MTVYLLDVNAIISLLWPSHVHHADTHRWFAKKARNGWATCSFTQAGFVRIVSNPSFSKDAATPVEALRLLAANIQHPQHRFLADDIGFVALVGPLAPKLVGHRQVSDAYLLGLALRHEAKLATLDTGIATLLPDEKGFQGVLERIPTAD
jgi:toxin-antitoxin system PIN domain toxin